MKTHLLFEAIQKARKRHENAICYTSYYHRAVDSNRRVRVPVHWRPAHRGAKMTLFVWPEKKSGLYLYVIHPELMANLQLDMATLPYDDPQKTRLKEFIRNKTTQVSLDQDGRITLPGDMMKAAGIDKEAVFLGVLDRFEIWNPSSFRKLVLKSVARHEKSMDLRIARQRGALLKKVRRT